MKCATRVVVSKLGTLAGLAGIEHGIGETLQGNVAPDGLMIVAWPGWELFRILAGEPAMTIIPSLLVTGILAILFSLLYLAWATVLVKRKNSGLVLILLSVIMLLAGAGYGSALLAFIIGLVATRINVAGAGRRTRLPAGIRHASVKLWPRTYVACVVAWLLLMPGTIILAYVFGTDNVAPALPVFILAAFGTLLLAIFTGFAYDGQQLADIGKGPQVKRLADQAAEAKADHPDRNDCINEAENRALHREHRA
jgi:hypothetical protein